MDTYTLFKVSEMVQPSRTPRPVVGMRVGMGAVTPAFLDASGNPISSIESGQPYGFNVPGYSSIWLTLSKDGQQVFNANFAVPMPLHVAQDSEIGTWQAIVYDSQSGQLIGSTTLQITAAGAATGSGGIVGFLSTLTPTQKALGAGAILFLLSRRHRK